MRVLHLTNLYPPHFQGGYELLCRDVVDHQRSLGLDAVVLTSDWRSPMSSRPDAPESHVHRLLPLFPPNGRYHRPVERTMAMRRAHRSLRHFLPSVEVVVTWNPSGIPITLLADLGAADVPVVSVIGDDWLIRRLDRSDHWLGFVRNHPAAASLAARVAGVPTEAQLASDRFRYVFCSAALREATAKAVDERFADAPVVHFGIDHRDFPVTQRNLPPWRGRLLYVGRADPRKGIDTAVQALVRLPSAWTLDIVCPPDEDATSRLLRIAADAGRSGQLRFRSAPRSELAAVYRDADALIFPSEWDEPFGLVPLEAMSQGTPVVATGTGGSAEYLGDGVNCVLFAPGEPDALASALETLAGDEDLRLRLSAAGLDTASAFGVERFAEGVTAVVHEVSTLLG